MVGERPRRGDLAATIVAGLAVGAIVVMRTGLPDWQSILLAVLAADIGAGLISNATEATRATWRRNADRRKRVSFLVMHLLAYPVVLYLLSRGDIWLFAILTGLLIAKVLAFAAGQTAEAVADKD